MPRKGERQKKDYVYLTRQEFKDWINKKKFLEYARVHLNLYGTPKDFVTTQIKKGYDVLLDIDVQGGRTLMKKFPDAVFIFLMPPSTRELARRLAKRAADSKTTIKTRLHIARKELFDAQHYDYIVLNQDLGKAVELIRSVIAAERCKRDT